MCNNYNITGLHKPKFQILNFYIIYDLAPAEV